MDFTALAEQIRIRRYVFHLGGESKRQASRGIHPTKKNVSSRVSNLVARVPRLQHAIDIANPWHRDSGALEFLSEIAICRIVNHSHRLQDNYGIGIGLAKSFDELILAARHLQRGSVEPLALPLRC